MFRVVGSLDLNSIAGSTTGGSVASGSVATGSVASGSVAGGSVGAVVGATAGWQAEMIMLAAKRTAINTYSLRIVFLLLERNIYFLI